MGAGLIPTNKERHSAIDRWRCNIAFLIGRLIDGKRLWLEPRRVLEPGRLQIFEEPFPAALAPEAAFAVAAETAGSVEKIGAVDPNNSGFQLRGDMERHVDALAPNTRGESIYAIVRQLHRFARRAEGHRRQHRTKNFLLRHDGCRMHVAQQRRRKIKTA